MVGLEPRNLGIVAQKELGDAWRNRWFLLFAATFTVVALSLSWISVVGVVGSGFAGFGRTAASLVNLIILVVPLMGLTLGATSIAGEKERGSLLYWLAQPLEPRDLLWGKFLGLSGAVFASLLLGFGVAGLVLAARGGSGRPGPFFAFLGLAALVAMATVSLGLLISTLSSKVSVAMGISLFVWLVFVFLGDLGIMGTSLALRLGAQELLLVSLINPLQVFKLAALLVIRSGLEILGPAGLYAARTYGDSLSLLLVMILVLWIVLPLGVATVLFQRRRGLV